MAISTFLPKAPEITEWTIVTRTAVSGESDTTAPFAVDFLSSAQICLSATDDDGGTSPTLDVSVEEQNADGTTYRDIARFSTLTSTNNLLPSILDFVHAGNAIGSSSTTIAAGTVRTANMGGYWRIQWTMSGTWTFKVFGNFKQ
jgi:hypothetical protein|tara:strand:- start:1612 stop:2043 length:432 start_codon:yes stop_codon:yes gene_type:complete